MENNKELQRIAKLAVNLTHEFTSPLSTLVATLEELQREEKEPKKRMQLDVALRNAYKYRSLTNDVFSISRAMNGNVIHNLAYTNIVDFIDNICMMFQTAAQNKKIKLQFTSSIKDLQCYVDYKNLFKIVYKLIANGIRFSNSNTGIVKVSLFHLSDSNQLQLEIWDNGIGIVPEKVPHVFSLNYDEDPIHLAHYQGTSIGLYLTKLLTELIGGTISVESTKFEYTKFKILLPIYTNPNTLPFDHVEIMDKESAEQLTSKEVVLNVDTDEILQIKSSKSDSNLVVIAANKKQEEYWKSIYPNEKELIFVYDIDIALGHIFDFVPDLIIIQEGLKDLNLKETIQFLKRNTVVSHIPIVVYSPDATVDSRKTLLSETKADDVIIDSGDAETTISRLNNLIENRKRVFESAWQKALNEIKTTKSLSLEDSFLSKLNSIIDHHISDDEFNVNQLSDEMFMSRTQIHRKLKAISNQSTTQYIKRFKLKKALIELEGHTGTISEIAYKFGFSSPAYFSRVFQEVYGKKPSEVIRNDR